MMKYIVLGLAGISAAAAACANPQTIDNQKTRNPPAISSDAQYSFFDGSSLKLRITSPVVTGRADAIITPYNQGALGTEADCIYNQVDSAYWTKSLSQDQCTEQWDLDAAWTGVSAKCEVAAAVNNSAELSFAGSFQVQQDETLDATALRNKAITRPYINILSYRVTFPKQITILSNPNITVFAPVRLVAAVTQQELQFQGIGQDPAYHGLITVLLSFQYPFEFNGNPTVAGDAGTMTVVAGAALANANWQCDAPSVAQSSGRQCQNSITFEGHEAAGLCQLDGTATISGAVQCNAAYAATDCPIQASDADATVSVTILSENYCDIVEATADLTGTLASYLSSNLAVARNAYFQDMSTWWLASVSSNNANVASVSVTDAKADGASFAAHASYQSWASGNQVLTGKTLAANEAAFRITAANTAGFQGVAQDSSKVFVVTADLSVTYNEASRKRMTAVRQVAPAETADVSVAGTAIIEAAPAAEETAQPAAQPATATTPYMTIVGVLAGVMSLLVCCAGVGLFAFVLTRRRSSQQQALVEA